MNTSDSAEWNERGSAFAGPPRDSESMFHLLFERTADAVWLFDPATATVVDCNKAAAALMRCESRADLIGKGAIELSAPEQPDGTHTGEIPAAPHERRRSTRQFQDFGFGGFQKQRTNSEKESLNTNLCEIGFVLDRSGSMKPKLRKRPRSP